MDISKELQVIGTRDGFMGQKRPVYDTPATPKENYLLALKGEGLWTPISSEQVVFSPRVIPDNISRGFVLDADPIDNATEAGGPDMFGVVWEWVPQVNGSMVRAEDPQMLGDIAKWEDVLAFPDPGEWDWEGSAAANKKYFSESLPLQVWFQNGLFERLISLMGFGEAAIALIDDEQKPHVHAFFDRLCSLYEDIFSRFKKHYDFDVVYFHDDWGGQYAPFFSLETVREMLLPYLKRLVGHIHGLGAVFEFHSCGKIEMLVPAMIEAGADIWSGQRINDHLALLEKHAGQIIFNVMPDITLEGHYTIEDVERIMSEFLDAYEPWFKDIIITNLTFVEENRNKAYELAYARSRKKLAR